MWHLVLGTAYMAVLRKHQFLIAGVAALTVASGRPVSVSTIRNTSPSDAAASIEKPCE